MHLGLANKHSCNKLELTLLVDIDASLLIEKKKKRKKKKDKKKNRPFYILRTLGDDEGFKLR